MLCYFNIGFDAWISNEFEIYRTKRRCTNKFYYFYLFLKLGTWSKSNFIWIKDVIENISEINSFNEKEVIFDSSTIVNNPFLMFGTNILSNYASNGITSCWAKNKNNNGLDASKFSTMSSTMQKSSQ
jgi:hypothetical protein